MKKYRLSRKNTATIRKNTVLEANDAYTSSYRKSYILFSTLISNGMASTTADIMIIRNVYITNIIFLNRFISAPPLRYFQN
jgi:hypothetical protein